MHDPQQSDANSQRDEVKLSPEALAALGKVRRRFGISIGVMLLGFMAIGFAIVYRVMRDAPPPPTVAELVLPAGAEVRSALSADGTIQVTYGLADAVMLSVFDAGTGALVRSITLSVGAPASPAAPPSDP